MSPDSSDDHLTRQAKFAEWLSAEPDSLHPSVRVVSLDGEPRGTVEHDAEEGGWVVRYWSAEGAYVTDAHSLMGEGTEDEHEYADRHGVGVMAEALARGDVAPAGGGS